MPEGEFKHGLCGCFGNCGICIVTFFVPCYTQGKIAEKVGDDCLICGLLQLVPIADIIFATTVRAKVREQKNIPGSIVGDCLTVFCCYFCALCQEAQEVEAFGSAAMAQSIERV